MKPFTKGLIAGLVGGVVLTIALEILALMGLGFWISSQMGRQTLASFVLPTPSFPEPGEWEVLGEADYDWPLRTLDGRDTTLGELRGRPVFLNLWATWCGPCVLEMPGIQSLQQSLGEAPVALLLVSKEDESTVRAFVERQEWELPVYVSAADDVPEVFRSDTVPMTWVVDREGRIVFEHAGAAQWDDESCREFLLAL